ncbi:cytochrome P450 [Diplocarpon rosae]|nr:cytochrome P450 [Diplocarpon rosae]
MIHTTTATDVNCAGPIVRIAPNHLSFGSHGAQKAIYGFNTRTGPSMAKDPVFFTPEVDHSMNIINETDREEHTRMRRMLSFAFSNSNLLENEDVLVRRTDDFVRTIAALGRPEAEARRGFNLVQQFNYVTFNIMGEPTRGMRGRDSRHNQVGARPGAPCARASQPEIEHRYHWADVIVNTTYMNDVMRAVCVVPGLFSFLEWLKPEHMRKTLYQHAAYATEHTEWRLESTSTRRDFMHHILTSRGPRPSTLEIGSHFNVIMMAGAVTTATFLSGVTYYLGHNKAALSRLQRELRARFQSLSEITSRDLMECVYLNAVVEEGLRIYPPAGAAHLSRIVPPGGCEIEGEWIPGGVRIHRRWTLPCHTKGRAGNEVEQSWAEADCLYPRLEFPCTRGRWSATR